MQISNWITEARFSEYRIAANGNEESAKALYEWNTAISSAFFEVISYVEIALRNAIDKKLIVVEVPENVRSEYAKGWWFASHSVLHKSEMDFYDKAQRYVSAQNKEKS